MWDSIGPKPRPYTVEVPRSWLRPSKGDSGALQRTKARLAATIGERAIERQCRAAERMGEQDSPDSNN